MDQIKYLVNECYEYRADLLDMQVTYSKRNGYQHDSSVSPEEFFLNLKPSLLSNLWESTFDIDRNPYDDSINSYGNLVYHYNKMSITKHIAVRLDEIGKDKTFYFLGKRHTKVGDLNKIAEHFGWKWEKKDASKADFFILGDNPTPEEASVNRFLRLPVVMDDEIRVQLHFLFNKEVTLEDVDNDFVASYLNSNDFDQLKMVISMIQFLKEGSLSPANRYRLIRAYVSSFNSRDFDLKNEEHVWMSDTVQRYCHPQHRYLVTNNFLTKKIGWIIKKDGVNVGKVTPWMTVTKNRDRWSRTVTRQFRELEGPIPNYRSSSRNLSFIHQSEGDTEVYLSDLEENNIFTVVTQYKFKTLSDYFTKNLATVIPNKLSSLAIEIKDTLSMAAWYIKSDEGEITLIDCGLGKYNGSNSLHSTEALISRFGEDNYKEVKSKLKSIFESLADLISMDQDGINIKEDDKSLLSYVIEMDILISNSIVKNSEGDLLKIKNRVQAAGLI